MSLLNKLVKFALSGPRLGKISALLSLAAFSAHSAAMADTLDSETSASPIIMMASASSYAAPAPVIRAFSPKVSVPLTEDCKPVTTSVYNQSNFEDVLHNAMRRGASYDDKAKLQCFVYGKAGYTGAELDAKVDGRLGRDTARHVRMARSDFAQGLNIAATRTPSAVKPALAAGPRPLRMGSAAVASNHHLDGAELFYKIGKDNTYVNSPMGYRVMSWSRRRNVGGDNYLPIHKGTDRVAPGIYGQPIVYRQEKGEVVLSKSISNGGNTTWIADPNNCVITESMHHSRNRVSVGQTVRSGDVIANVGATGRVTGPHFHGQVEVMSTTSITGALQLYTVEPGVAADMLREGKSMCTLNNANEAIARTANKTRVPTLALRRANLTRYSMEELEAKMGINPSASGRSSVVTAIAENRQNNGSSNSYNAYNNVPAPIAYSRRLNAVATPVVVSASAPSPTVAFSAPAAQTFAPLPSITSSTPVPYTISVPQVSNASYVP